MEGLILFIFYYKDNPQTLSPVKQYIKKLLVAQEYSCGSTERIGWRQSLCKKIFSSGRIPRENGSYRPFKYTTEDTSHYFSHMIFTFKLNYVTIARFYFQFLREIHQKQFYSKSQYTTPSTLKRPHSTAKWVLLHNVIYVCSGIQVLVCIQAYASWCIFRGQRTI